MRRWQLLSAVVLCVPLCPASAVVNQVDGLVVPVAVATACPHDLDHCVQTGLNFGEGINPPNAPPVSPGPVDAVLDANTGPETFLIPQTAGSFNTVTVRLLQEGASYENIFGWYNVGEPNKRYPVIFSCRGGNQALYEPPSYDSSSPPKLAGGYTATVDFQAELVAGRYKGKQVGFYLVTPEGNTTGTSCAADPSDQGVLVGGAPGGPIDDDNTGSAADDGNGLGRVYFTESKLQSDGNYVHYLIYQSKKEPKHFYFAFEDLFRGGDNDYDDTLIKVEGLVPTCQPQPEICNGVDDNCNGAVDENVFRPCATACGTGQEQCQFTNDGDPGNDWVGCTAPKPQTEVCNGVDEDCDKTPDNNLPPGPSCTLGGCTGQIVCVAGKLVCGASTPTTEVCDGKDNDCDGKTDEDLSRVCASACGFGVETCAFTNDGDAANDWVGCTAPAPGTEVCDGIDNDCDGTVDDDVAGEGLPCDHPSGKTCAKGKTKCVGGKITCFGATTGTTEVCDCKDNDCDGQIDEDNPCPASAVCDQHSCGCRIPCGGVEFGCPKAFACKDGLCVPDTCASVSCTPDQKCVGGACISRCEGVSCPGGQVCRAGACVEDNCYGKGCAAGEVCLEERCVADPCSSMSCKAGEYCAAGSCKPSCGPARCGRASRCADGVCLPDPCASVTCTDVPCVDGTCDQACAGVSCGARRLCRQGKCIDDPCTLVRCYDAAERCEAGQCVTDRTKSGSQSDVLAAGGGGCTCSLDSRDGGAALDPGTWLLLLALLAWRARPRPLRRARRRRELAIALLGAALLLAACEQDPFTTVTPEDGGSDLPPPDASACVKTNGGVELCDGVDNDCDGPIDEDFNLESDPQNCGKCGASCLLPGALTACELRACKYRGCAPGFHDLNADASDGCEYACSPTGDEACDGKDNDCNGQTDETFDLKTDVENCGGCGNVCQLANATSKCDGGSCRIQKCAAGFIDKDQQDGNGCETACTPTSGGVELCDGVDNDCNGVIDDPGGKVIDFSTDALNCGGCGVVCVVPNAAAACKSGKCAFASCTAGYVDADQDAANGCECLPDGPEKCDGKDNDCNGLVDDGLATGICGSAVGECKAGTLSCKNGVEICTGKVDPKPELCDGKDSDCNGELDPPACVFAGSGRERRLDQPGLSTLGASNSTQLSVAGNGARVLAVWLDRRNGQGDIYANLSTDGGKSWSASDIAVAVDSGDKLEPRAAFGGPTATSVRAYVVYEIFSGAGRDVVLRRSTDGGGTWGAAVAVNKTAGGDALFVRLAVVPAASSGGADKVVVCWERINVTGAISPNILCSLSTDSGLTFAASNSQVTTSGNAIVPELAVDAGYAYVTWQQGTGIRVARASLSGGALAFVNETSLATGAGQLPQIAADGTGRVVVVWEDLRDPLINLRANRSSTSGASWLADGVRVDNDVVNGDSTQARVAMRPGGRVFATWTDTSRGKPDVYVNHSDDGGATWAPAARRVEASPLAASISARPALALAPTGNRVYVAWEDYRNGAYRDVYFSLSLDDGITWNVPDYRINEPAPAGAADAQSPALWAGPGRVAVLWLDNRALTGGVVGTGPNADVYCSYVE